MAEDRTATQTQGTGVGSEPHTLGTAGLTAGAGHVKFAAKPSVTGWSWRWQSDWVPWFERGPEPFVWRLNIGPLHIVRITVVADSPRESEGDT